MSLVTSSYQMNPSAILHRPFSEASLLSKTLSTKTIRKWMPSTSGHFRGTLFFEHTMKKTVILEKRKTFRHGDLRNALLAAGIEMARIGGPNTVILRKATRLAGVSPNAAYRHFANQAELLDAVRSACFSQLAAAIEEEMKKCRPGRDPQAFARKSLRAVGMGLSGIRDERAGDVSHSFSPFHPLYMSKTRRTRPPWA